MKLTFPKITEIRGDEMNEKRETFAMATRWEIECPFCEDVHEVDELPSETEETGDRPLICPCGAKIYMYISQEGDAVGIKDV